MCNNLEYNFYASILSVSNILMAVDTQMVLSSLNHDLRLIHNMMMGNLFRASIQCDVIVNRLRVTATCLCSEWI